MSRLEQKDIEYLLLDAPVLIGQTYGFNKLTELHNEWIQEMVLGTDDATLQGHRGSYKTTCLSVALACIAVIYPYDTTMFMRKTDDDVKEIVAQTKKILLSDVMQSIVVSMHSEPLKLTVDNATELSTTLAANKPGGTSQLVAIGMGTSITGKHFDRIFTDDIVNIKDRVSRAERERTKTYYQELINIKNRGGRIFNTGTPWHKDDAFCIMPQAEKYPWNSTGLITEAEAEEIKSRMTASLFAANYELRHIAAEDVIFTNPIMDGDRAKAEQGICHIDAAYSGSDYTAFTICNKIDNTYYVYGRLWRKHVDDVEDEIIAERKAFNAGRISLEDNGDKGYLSKELQKKGERTHLYHEKMNKHLKITSYLKAEWKNVVFVQGTDLEYIAQIEEFNENAEHDDAPDSLASIIRELWRKKPANEDSALYFL